MAHGAYSRRAQLTGGFPDVASDGPAICVGRARPRREHHCVRDRPDRNSITLSNRFINAPISAMVFAGVFGGLTYSGLGSNSSLPTERRSERRRFRASWPSSSVLVIEPRSMVAPLECSGGLRPRSAINCRGLSTRLKVPTSTPTVVAARIDTPLSACTAATAATTGASVHRGTTSTTGFFSRSHSSHAP